MFRGRNLFRGYQFSGGFPKYLRPIIQIFFLSDIRCLMLDACKQDIVIHSYIINSTRKHHKFALFLNILRKKLNGNRRAYLHSPRGGDSSGLCSVYM